MNAHLGNVGPLVGALLAEAATLDSIQLHGPAAELAKCKEGMDPLGTVYFETYGCAVFLYNVAYGVVWCGVVM